MGKQELILDGNLEKIKFDQFHWSPRVPKRPFYKEWGGKPTGKFAPREPYYLQK